MRKLLFLFICFLLPSVYTQAQDALFVPKESLMKSTLLLADEQGTAGGLLLNVNNDIYIVTTEHVSTQINKGTKVYMTGNNSKFVELPFEQLLGNRDMNWKYSLSADLAILKIATDTSRFFTSIKSHALDYTRINHTRDTIAKSTELTVMGHAVADTVKGTIVPIVVNSKFSAGPINLMENNVRYSYYLLPLTNNEGFIGSPVYAAVKSEGSEKSTLPKTLLVGIVNNFFLGGDSAQMIPANFLYELISN
jgi:hypothetical protein